MLPRSAVHELSYSLIPGTLIIGGTALVRPDLLWGLLTMKELSDLVKAGAVGLAILVSGFLCMAVVGGILLIFFAALFAMIYLTATHNTPVSYGSNIIWRRLAARLAGEGISRVQEAGLPMDQYKAKVQELISQGSEPKQTPEGTVVEGSEQGTSEKTADDPKSVLFKVLSGKLGDALIFAAQEVHKEPTDLEWQSVYRILTDYFNRPVPEVYYSSMALLSSSAVLWTFHHYWLSSISVLWYAAVAAFIAGGLGAGFLGIALTNGATGDEVQAAEILRILKPRPKETSKPEQGLWP
jgi:hypothetical protein